MWLDDTDTTTDATDTTTTDSTTTTLTPQQKMSTLLSVDSFKNARPNMVSFSDSEIQECINTSMDMLDALCGGLISQVCGYNVVDDRTTLDTTNQLYRTDFQMSQLTRAFIIQTQYTLNLGNDFSIGSTSMSTGGLNGAFQRPADRDIYAPGVKEALRLAGVYTYQAFGLTTQDNTNLVNINDLLTRETADGRYVQTYQKNGAIGSIAQIDSNLMVSFVDPSSVSFNITQAKTIWDPQNSTYQPIDKVSNIAWISGANKNVDTPQEVDTKIQTAINNVPQLTYISFYAGEILAFATDNDYQQFKNETGTTDDDFRNLYVDGSTWIFKSLGSNIESKSMYLLDLDKVPEFVDLKNQVATNTTDIATNTTSITNLTTQQNTNTTNITALQNQQTTNTNNITTLQTTISNLPNNYVTISTSQILTGAKYFTNGLIIRQKQGYSGYIQYQNSTGGVLDNIGFIKEADTTNNLLTFTFQNSKVINVPNIDTTSTAFTDTSLVPKSYVDTQIANLPTERYIDTTVNTDIYTIPISDDLELQQFGVADLPDQDILFISISLPDNVRRYSILQINTDNKISILATNLSPNGSGITNGVAVRIYYYQ